MIVMGLDQHRAQITADWLETSTGEASRAQVAPADRAGVRALVQRFGDRELEVAWEATTGWRFVVEELHRAGAVVHLAETAARRGKKQRAKNDRADARHLRELVMIGRLPESWSAPQHILDLRARVRLRHTGRRRGATEFERPPELPGAWLSWSRAGRLPQSTRSRGASLCANRAASVPVSDDTVLAARRTQRSGNSTPVPARHARSTAASDGSGSSHTTRLR